MVPRQCLVVVEDTLSTQAGRYATLERNGKVIGLYEIFEKQTQCLNFKWISGKLQVWILWVDDCLILGQRNNVIESKEQMKRLFDCDDIGEMREYVGCKVLRGDVR
jgi:hypothetical protein